MTNHWTCVSEDAGTISLHDHRISRVEEAGANLIFAFESGFDVTKDNSLNPTGRHRNTDPAAIILEGWQFIEGAFNRSVEVHYPDGTRRRLPEKPLSKELFLSGAFEVEVLDFDWTPETGAFHLDGDGGIYYDEPDTPDGPVRFVTLDLYVERLLFCWNDLPRDAWFQDWPRQ